MKYTYDKNVDAVYIYLDYPNKVNTTDSFSIDKLLPFGDVNIDFDMKGLIVGIEILNASKYLSANFLKNAEKKQAAI